MSFPDSALANRLDTLYANTGTIGQILLLNGTLSARTYTVDPSTDAITTTIAHGWATGTRVRATSDNTSPAIANPPLEGATWYVKSLSNTTLKLYPTLADAKADTNAADFINTGTGTHTLTEQEFTQNEDKAVLVAHELSHPDYSRIAVSNLGASIVQVGYAQKPLVTWNFAVGSSNPSTSIDYLIILFGGSSTVGDTTGTIDAFYHFPSTIVVTPGNSQMISFQYILESE